MGFFGGDDDQSEAEQLMEEQIRENKEELELKRKNLYEERLEIIKGQGGQSWTPTVTSASSGGGGKSSSQNSLAGSNAFGPAFASDVNRNQNAIDQYIASQKK